MSLIQRQQHSSAFARLYAHTRELVGRPSVTPVDKGCQLYLAEKLTALGFVCQHVPCENVDNLIARYGHGPIRLAFAGHTDVVPAGDCELWQSPPFAAYIVDNHIIGRGVADMKGGIAAMLTALENNLSALDPSKYSFYFLITSDEEGEAEFGTRHIVEQLKSQDALPHFCIVGEPTASDKTGDVIKVGRRGALSAEVVVKGKQGHVAYPQHANNAAHTVMDIGKTLTDLAWDAGSDDFPGTSLQITGINTGAWTDNIIPGQCKLCFNLRFDHHYSIASLKQRIQVALAGYHDVIEIEWLRPCEPYFTDTQALFDISLVTKVEQAIYGLQRRFPRLSTSGGTSDGRFLANQGCQVIELGVPNRSIHQINERVAIDDLIMLERIYARFLQSFDS